MILREISILDAEKLFEIRRNSDAMKFLDRPVAQHLDEAKDLIHRMLNDAIQNQGIGWAISLAGCHDLIGTIGFYRISKENHRAEIGYMLHPQFWRQGLMSEALVRIIDFGFQSMKLHSIEADINPNNLASKAILEKNNFVKEASFKENVFFDGRFLDSDVYSLIASVD